MLKEDAVLTIFGYNANKQLSKRRASVLRVEAATKKKLCDDTFMHNKLVQNFEFVINTKATQPFWSNKQMTSASTQMEFDPTNTCEVSIQCNIEHIQCNIEQRKTHGDENLETESDEKTSEESEYSISDQTEAEYSSSNESTSVSSPSKATFIVYWYLWRFF